MGRNCNDERVNGSNDWNFVHDGTVFVCDTESGCFLIVYDTSDQVGEYEFSMILIYKLKKGTVFFLRPVDMIDAKKAYQLCSIVLIKWRFIYKLMKYM
ncbi:hypothetical protein SAMN02745781_02526 [Vibrio gazogenes DSM 21264]|uniref:Uncharacterized protein n=1 Tax=Vibrio gazogenes DSM 21264 = NBRC 103151 TaxID=1123492 RepID=A0A1M5CBB2_VIBGA|nr:hypothetical protein SAMN02745781_02526 [Vibrio gazogenes DSM 21264] [Vibrio gazogenes DSM 21264 = NBRC 103151]SJN53202.1 hypothetical protein BQ6471_00315 [Vibrio gazogenes]